MSRETAQGSISVERLVEDLKRIGVCDGDTLAFGIAFRTLGRVSGGAEGFIDALLAAVGPRGTIMCPTFTLAEDWQLQSLARGGYVYDRHSTPGYTGLVPETLRKRPDCVRSGHPSNSVAALGPRARQLTDGHEREPSPYAPYSRLAEVGGKLLVVGLGDRLVALRHEAQYRAGLLSAVPSPLRIAYLDDAGDRKTFVVENRAGCVKRLSAFVGPLRSQGLVTDGRIGEAAAVLVPAAPALDGLTQQLASRPSSNLCSDLDCLWCRELERRMDLYGELESPRLFQRSKPVIALVAAVNRLRLANVPAIVALEQGIKRLRPRR